MVRIRSDRWYSSDGQRRSSRAVRHQTHGSRRVLSMCFLLALVILLMQQAADPRYVSNAFRALGVPLEGRPSEGDVGAAEASNEGAVVGMERRELPRHSLDATWQATLDDLLPRLLEDRSGEELEALAAGWFELPSRLSADSKKKRLETMFASHQATLKALAEAMQSDESAAKWADALARFDRQWKQVRLLLLTNVDATSDVEAASDRTSESIDLHLQADLSRFLDDLLVRSLADGAPWRKEESTTFWRLISRCRAGGNSGDSQSFPRVNTYQLESEADDLKGRTLRFAGSVRRVERVERKSQELGVDHYWLIWMRGEDGASQPVAVYTCDERAAEWQRRLEVNPQDFAEIEVQAISAKRLPYGAESGLEIAPTLFVTRILSASSVSGANRLVASSNAQNELIWKDVRFSALLGVMCALFVVVRISRSWKRSPIFRQKTLSYKTKSKQRNVSSVWLLWIAVVAASAGASPAYSQEKPAWAKESSKQRQRLEALGLLLERAFSPRDMQQLQWYLQGETQTLDSFPDAILKAMQSVEKVGWGVLGSDAVIPVSSGSVFRRAKIQGYVRLAMPVALSDEQRSWFFQTESEKFYRLALVPQGSKELTWVFTKDIPSVWTESPALFQPVELSGLLLEPESTGEGGTAEAAELGQRSCFLAEEISWTLDSKAGPELKPQLPALYEQFGKAGWNLAWLDRIARNNQQPLQEEESEAFFSTLRLVGRPDAKLAVESENGPSTSSPLKFIKQAQDSFGRPLHWRVRLVQGARVKVPEEDRAALGQDHYFQFDGFIDIGNKQIGFNVAGQTEVFEREFPVTLVTCSAEQFVPQKELEEGTQAWAVGKYAEVEGVFYRMWSYSSDRIEKIREQGRQAAPLVVASRISLSAPVVSRRDNPGMQWFSYALCIATLAILGAMLFFASQKDRRRYSKLAPIPERKVGDD